MPTPSVASERLYGGVLTDTIATVFTASLRTEITAMRIMAIGDDLTANLAEVYHVPSGATQGNEHLIYNGNAIVDSSVSQSAGVTMEAGDTIQAKADADDKMVLTLYGTTESVVG